MDVSKAHDKATVEATLLGRISTHRAKIGSTMRSLPMTTALILINVALVCITAWYALTTHRLLSESQKTGADLKRIAEVAEASLHTLRAQIEAQTGVNRGVVEAAIQTGLRSVDYWTAANIPSLAAQYALLSQIHLKPDNAADAIEHVRRLSSAAAGQLAAAFADLTHAGTEIETMREAKSVPVDFYPQRAMRVTDLLQSAKRNLEAAKQELRL